MGGLLLVLAAAATSVLTAAFFPYLPFPFADLFVPVVAVSFAVFSGRPVAAFTWAFVSGLVLDLHGFYAFGAETAVLMGTAALLKLAFRRVITNSTLLAGFLLGAVAYASHLIGLFAFDGARVLFGQSPLLISFEAPAIAGWIRGLFVNAAFLVLALWTVRSLRRRFENTFIVSA